MILKSLFIPRLKYEIYGELLKELRQLKNLSQTELAHYSLTTPQMICDLENGRRRFVNEEIAKGLSEALK